MQADDARRWIEDRRFVDEYERRSSAALDPGTVWRHEQSLLALLDWLIGWPVAPDEIRQREDEAARLAWQQLRARYRRLS